MNHFIYKKFFIFFVIACALFSTSLNLSMTSRGAEENVFLNRTRMRLIKEKYKALNYTQETLFMKEDFGRIINKSGISPIGLECEDISEVKTYISIAELATKGVKIGGSLAFIIFFGSLYLFEQSPGKEVVTKIMLMFPFWASLLRKSPLIMYYGLGLFVYFLKIGLFNKDLLYQEYGSLLLEKIKKEEMSEEWHCMQDKK